MSKPASPPLNRRNFIAGSAAAAAAAAFSAQAATRKPSPLEICAFEKPVQQLSFDALADLLAELGFDGVEATVRPGGHIVPERVEEDLPKMVEALKSRGLAVTALASGVNRADDPAQQRVLQTAALLGVKRYRMAYYRYDLDRPISPQLWEFKARMSELAALNKDLGLVGIYQNHAGARYVGAPLWDLFWLLNGIAPTQIAAGFDIRHATVEGGTAWPLNFKLLRPHVGMLFAKDFVWEKGKVKNVPLGRGLVDPQFFKMALDSGFSGPVTLHVEYFDHRQKLVLPPVKAALKKDLAKLRSWLG